MIDPNKMMRQFETIDDEITSLRQQVATLTEQRDMAVEVLRLCVDHISGHTAWTTEEEDAILDKAIATIQSSEVKE